MAAGRISLALISRGRAWAGWSIAWIVRVAVTRGLNGGAATVGASAGLRQHLSVQARERHCNLFARRVWLERLQRLGDSLENGGLHLSGLKGSGYGKSATTTINERPLVLEPRMWG